MSWRYQPVFTEQDGERSYSLCEVYFDEAGKLETWTENEAIAPGGSTVEDLTGDIAHMMADAYSWKPVRFSDLKPGFVFEKAISMEEGQRLADFIEHTKEAFARAPAPRNN